MIWDASSGKENSTRHISYFHWRHWFGYLLLKMEDIVRQWWLLIAVHRKQHLDILSSLGSSEQVLQSFYVKRQDRERRSELDFILP